MRRLLFLLPLWGLISTAGAATLQALIDATPTGGMLKLAPGTYQGPISINRSITIEGSGKAHIQGNGTGTVVSVAGRGVTLRGLRISGSGESHDTIDAGILLAGDEHRVEDNQLDDVLFGLHLRQISRSQIRRNTVVGKSLSIGLRGDAVRLWYSRDNVIEANRFRRARDLTFTNSPDNRMLANHFTDGRYGMHVIFSPRLQIENNRLEEMETGIVVLYSPGVILRGNHIAHALKAGGGLVFKDSDDGLVENNEILHCAVGLRVDAPPQPVGVLTVRNNRFAHNIVGMFFYGEAGGHKFTNNHFENNLTMIAISAQGAGAGNVWHGNYWDDYQGFDRNGDGVGDQPHEVHLFADRIWMETPMATFFRSSPVLELLDFLERLAPFSLPYRVLRDLKPLMR